MEEVVQSPNGADHAAQPRRHRRVGDVRVGPAVAEEHDIDTKSALGVADRTGEPDIALLQAGLGDLETLPPKPLRNRIRIRLGGTETGGKLLRGDPPMVPWRGRILLVLEQLVQRSVVVQRQRHLHRQPEVGVGMSHRMKLAASAGWLPAKVIEGHGTVWASVPGTKAVAR